MITVCEKPECFKELGDEFVFFEGSSRSGFKYAYAAVSFLPPSAYMHLEVLKWSHNVFKSLIVDWSILKNTIKKQGVKDLIITKRGTLDSNKGYVKFLNRMGLNAPDEVLIGNYRI